MVIPNWAEQLIKKEDLELIEAKVSVIEKESDVEILPVIVERSSTYPQTIITLHLCLAIFGLLTLFMFFENQTSIWDTPFHPWHLRLAVLTVFGLVVLFNLYSSFRFFKNTTLVRLLNHRYALQNACEARAELEFYKERLQEIHKKNGILIYISLLERQVVIRADENIQSKFNDNEIWKEEVDIIISSIKRNNLGEGIYKALDHLQPLLLRNFPLTSRKDNLVPNTVIIKE